MAGRGSGREYGRSEVRRRKFRNVVFPISGHNTGSSMRGRRSLPDPDAPTISIRSPRWSVEPWVEDRWGAMISSSWETNSGPGGAAKISA